jgi:hypothetical protein
MDEVANGVGIWGLRSIVLLMRDDVSRTGLAVYLIKEMAYWDRNPAFRCVGIDQRISVFQ